MKTCDRGHIYDELKNGECPYCGVSVTKRLSTDYEGRCGNCHERLNEEDEYCRYCGTKKGEGRFEPYENCMPRMYSSPITYIYKCKSCGRMFKSIGLSALNPKFCYKCGSEVQFRKTVDELETPKPHDVYDGTQLMGSVVPGRDTLRRKSRLPADNEFVREDEITEITQKKTPERPDGNERPQYAGIPSPPLTGVPAYGTFERKRRLPWWLFGVGTVALVVIIVIVLVLIY